jgi:ribosomal protein S8
MSMQDLMSDFVARVNNAVSAGQTQVAVLKNNLVVSVSKKLTKLNYFSDFKTGEREVIISLAPKKITKLKRISKPGLRVYAKATDKFKSSGWNRLYCFEYFTGYQNSYRS